MRIIFSIIVLLFLLPAFSSAWSYPFKKVSKVECKFSPWSEHGSDCKRDLPILENANYEKYKNNQTIRLIYSVLWGSTYKQGWDIGYGSHLGTDIATAKGTPIYSIGDGKVIKAGWLQGWGNTVVIRHKINGKYIFSNYAHLNKINVNSGETVKEGKRIGEVGNTGNSWGNHLHFQIDVKKKTSHPFYYNCNGTIAGIVNKGLCRDQVSRNTTDPIHFLETNGADIKLAKNEDEIEKNNQELEKKNKINPNEIISREKLLLTQLEMFLARYDINVDSNITANVLSNGNNGTLNLTVKRSYTNRDFNGILPLDIDIIYDKDILKIIPESIKYIQNGNRKINITAKKPGVSKVIIKIDGKVIDNFNIRVKGKNTSIKPDNSIIKTLGNNYIGMSNRGINIMKDNSFNNIINVPFKGNFTLYSSDNVVLCPSGINSISKINQINSINCNTSKLKNKINFSYQDTLKGILLFKTIPHKEGSYNLEVYNGNKKLGSTKGTFVRYPKDLDRKSPYYNYTRKALKNLYVRAKDGGYFAPDFKLRETTAINWIENTFGVSSNKNGDRYNYLSRIEFIKLISELTNISTNNDGRFFIDISSENRKYANILGEKEINFLGKFDKYLQPNKKITREEATYILYKIQEEY